MDESQIAFSLGDHNASLKSIHEALTRIMDTQARSDKDFAEFRKLIYARLGEMGKALSDFEHVADMVEVHAEAIKVLEKEAIEAASHRRALHAVAAANKKWIRFAVYFVSLFVGDHFSGNKLAIALGKLFGGKP